MNPQLQQAGNTCQHFLVVGFLFFFYTVKKTSALEQMGTHKHRIYRTPAQVSIPLCKPTGHPSGHPLLQVSSTSILNWVVKRKHTDTHKLPINPGGRKEDKLSEQWINTFFCSISATNKIRIQEGNEYRQSQMHAGSAQSSLRTFHILPGHSKKVSTFYLPGARSG